MALRTVEIVLPLKDKAPLDSLLSDLGLESYWTHTNTEHCLFKMVMDAGRTEDFTDKLQKRFSKESLQLVISDVEATIPRLEDEKESREKKQKKRKPLIRISREELYNDMHDAVNTSWNFIILMILSSIVAGIGILEDNIAIVIGAMVIAPMLGPNVALAFATTLGDLKLFRTSIITAAIGTIIALSVAIIWGILDETVLEMPLKDTMRYSSVVLALVAGVAAVLSILGGISATFVGVMVAVALLPPLIETGLLIGGKMWQSAFYAALLFAVNIICLNLAGIFTFLFAGIRPNKWWEAKKAKKQTIKAIIAWTIMLLLLITIMFYLNNKDMVINWF